MARHAKWWSNLNLHSEAHGVYSGLFDANQPMQKLKNKIRMLSATNTVAAVSLSYCLGLSGLLRGRRGSVDHIKSTFSLFRKSSIIKGLPMNITIEPTNMCNLKCPICETGAGILDREKGRMTLDQFKMIIDKIASHVNTLMFYFMGEPFFNKYAYDMIRYAKKRGIPFVDTCTNGDLVNPDELISCGIDRVSFQIGGMSQETHQVYRVNSVLESIIDNLRECLRLRRERNAPLIIETGFILMKHNEHEAKKYIEFMSELGVDRASVIDPCVRTIDQGYAFLPSDKNHWCYNYAEFKNGRLTPKTLPENMCPWIYYSTVILVNGDVVPCCRDATGKFVMGNILQQNLEDIWNGEKFKKFRKMLLKNQTAISICNFCSSYPPSQLK